MRPLKTATKKRVALTGLLSLIFFAQIKTADAADWVEFFEAENLTVFVDHQTIHTEGDMVRLTTLMSYENGKNIRGVFHSSVDDWLLDCSKFQRKILRLRNFSGFMGDGVLVYESKHGGDWKTIDVMGLDYHLLRFACSIKPDGNTQPFIGQDKNA